MASDSAGRIFVPKGHCGFPWLATSSDGGTTWSRVEVSKKIGAADIQTAVAVDSADNLYYVWWDDVQLFEPDAVHFLGAAVRSIDVCSRENHQSANLKFAAATESI